MLSLLHFCTFLSFVTELVCALDHSSNAFALAHTCHKIESLFLSFSLSFSLSLFIACSLVLLLSCYLSLFLYFFFFMRGSAVPALCGTQPPGTTPLTRSLDSERFRNFSWVAVQSEARVAASVFEECASVCPAAISL